MAWIMSEIVILQYQVKTILYTSGITEGWRLEIRARDDADQRVNMFTPSRDGTVATFQ